MRGIRLMNLKKTGFYRDLGLKAGLFLCAALLAVLVSNVTYAANPASPCDPEYMDALESRAWLEAEREIAQNKNLIYKPDSVLQYTCFDKFLNEAASNFGAERQFSETTHWGGSTPSGFSQNSTDDALKAMVLDPLVTYLLTNFNDSGGAGKMGTYLNNRLPGNAPDPNNMDVTGANYSCDQMQMVWQEARCMNFMEEPKHDGFYDFLHYETDTNDPRREDKQWAMWCTGPGNTFAKTREAAFNARQALFDVTTDPATIPGNGTPYNEDNVITYLGQILPGACGASQKVPTGIMVQRTDINNNSPYAEIVCTMPGCSATAGGGCQP